MNAVYLPIAAALLLLNAFFVLAEFGMVKLRSTRVEELIDDGISAAKLVQHIQNNLDEYLSVCQVGITFASVGLGFVGEPAFARLLQPLFGSWVWAHAASLTTAYILVSYLHVVFGELVPKSLAIRMPEGSALLTARPMRLSRAFLYVPLFILNGSANLVLRLMGFASPARDPSHSEDELKIILEKSQTMGLMSFRRLLLIENVFDLGNVKVRDAMRPRSSAKVLKVAASWEENFQVIKGSRHSRFPLIGEKGDRPIGIVHIKDFVFENPEQWGEVDLRKIARAYPTAREASLVETLLAELQRRRTHFVIVLDQEGKWTGFITFEDIIEEIIGRIEDEFEAEPPVFLADVLSLRRIVLDLEADTMDAGIRKALARVPPEELPIPLEKVRQAIESREVKSSTYMDKGVAIPHARIEGLEKPALILARSKSGMKVRGREEKARLLFILLTPAATPRVQLRLLARIVGLMDSEYVEERLLEAKTPQAVLETIRTGDPVALS